MQKQYDKHDEDRTKVWTPGPPRYTEVDNTLLALFCYDSASYLRTSPELLYRRKRVGKGELRDEDIAADF